MDEKWKDFILCAVGGWFGFHKFREGETVWGVCYLLTVGLLLTGWLRDCYDYFQVAKGLQPPIPKRVKRTLRAVGDPALPLPVYDPGPVLLAEGEKCHFSARAKRRVESAQAETQGAPQVFLRGMLVITDQRAVFAASRGGFDVKLEAIEKLDCASRYFFLQTREERYALKCREARYAWQTLQRILHERGEEGKTAQEI